MNLRLYGPRGTCPGGGEKYMDALAKALSREHTVTQVDNPIDANVVQSNEHGYGNKLAYVLQIPYGPINADTMAAKIVHGQVREARRDLGRKQLLIDAKHSKLVLVYSEFVREVLAKYHGIDATVLYPPVQDYSSDIQKKKVILSVGRFYERRIYNHKRQDVLIEAFKMFHRQKPGWELFLVGGAEKCDLPYVHRLREQAAGYPIFIEPNACPEMLRDLYAEALLYWHAAGYEARGPEECEHFGISVVEAMSAGCVPYVLPSGGPVEVVGTGAVGLYWDNVGDLADNAAYLVDHPHLLALFTRNARRRFTDFTVAKFQERALSIFGKPR